MTHYMHMCTRLDKHVITRSDPGFITDQPIVTLPMETKPLITLWLASFILSYTKRILLVSQLLKSAIAHLISSY